MKYFVTLLSSLVLFVELLTVTPPALAQQRRAIPVEARRAQISPYDTSAILVNGQLVRLSAGARIRNQQNRFITPTKIPHNSVARVRYDENSVVRAVWLLTEEEIAAKDPDPTTSRRPGVAPSTGTAND